MGQILSKFAEFDRAVLSDIPCHWADGILPQIPTTFEELENNTIFFVSKEHLEQDIITISDGE